MEFREALTILGIEEYSERIFNSNSRGELFHLLQYIELAKLLGKTDWFAGWFEQIVGIAKKEWKRPESVFQHTQKLLTHQVNQLS